MTAEPDDTPDDIVARIPLASERAEVGVQTVETGRVRIATRTVTREQEIDTERAWIDVEIERVAIGRVVDSAPAVREEGDVTIVPVMEEVVVVERRLVLREEVRIRRVRRTELHRETIELRAQNAEIERVTSKP